MRHHQHHAAGVGELAQHQHHLAVQRRIQAGGRLVEEQQRRLGQQFQRDRRAFALPAGELVDAGVGVLGQVEFLEHLRDDLGAFLFAGVRRQSQLGGVTQRLVDRQLPVHHVVLRDHPDSAAHRRVLGVDVVALERDRSGAGAGVSGDQPRQRGLARAGPPDDRGQRARPRREGDSVQEFLAVDPEVNAVDLQAAGAGRGFGAADQVAVGEDEVDVADRDHVALVQHRRADAHAVDEGAVDAVCVPDLGAERRVDQECVMTRRQHVLDHDVVVVGATDRRRTRRLVRSERAGQDRLDHLGGQVADFGWRADRRRRHFGLRRNVHRGSRSHRGRGLPDRRWRLVLRARRVGRRALALVAGLWWGTGIRARRSGADRPLRPRPGGRAWLLWCGSRPGGRRRFGDRHRRRLRRPADDTVVASDLESQLRPIGIADVDGLAVVDVDHRHAAPVDVGAVQRAVVDGQPAALVEAQQQVCPGDQRMCDAHVGAQIAANHDVVTCGEGTL